VTVVTSEWGEGIILANVQGKVSRQREQQVERSGGQRIPFAFLVPGNIATGRGPSQPLHAEHPHHIVTERTVFCH
jgi:hypothetical protein